MMLLTTLFTLPLLLPPVALLQGGTKAAHPKGATSVEQSGQSTLTIEYYQPTNAPAQQLAGAMQQLAPVGGNYRGLPAFVIFGETLLVKDEAERMPETLAMLRRLDGAFVEQPGWEEPVVETFRYQVRHAPLDSVLDGLRGAFQGPQRGPVPASIGSIEDRSTVVFRGSPEEVKEVRQLVEALDVPLPQLLITLYVIEGVEKADADPRLPADLTRDLATLVPYEAFSALSMGFLPTDTVSPLELQSSFEAESGEFKLEMHPQAHDAESGTLTFGRIEFEAMRLEESGKNRLMFHTSTSLRKGQYTVLGAVGADPVFVVAKM